MALERGKLNITLGFSFFFFFYFLNIQFIIVLFIILFWQQGEVISFVYF